MGRRWYVTGGVLAWCVLCAVGRAARGDEVMREASGLIGEAVVYDITDPARPVVVTRGENRITLCGLLGVMVGATLDADWEYTSDVEVEPYSLYPRSCGSYDLIATQACTFPPASPDPGRIVIGDGGTGCTGLGTPWFCCTAAGVDCQPTVHSLILFRQGDRPSAPEQAGELDLNNQLTAWRNAGRPGVAEIPYAYADISMSHTGTETALTLRATAGATVANQPWCEWGLRSRREDNCGFGPVGDKSGWLFNHGRFTPCVTKASGSVWQIEVTYRFLPPA